MDTFIFIKPKDLEALLERTMEKVLKKAPNKAEENTEALWLNPAEAALYLKIKKSSIYQLTHKHKVKFYRVGAGLRFRKEDLDDLLQAGAQSIVRKSFLN